MDYSTTRKWSEIHNLAVVALSGGKKVGTVEDFYFDPQSHTVPALRVKTGLFSHRGLMAKSINAFGLDAVTIANESELITEKDDEQLQTFPLGQSLLSYRVMSAGGTIIGNIGNVLLDTSTPSVVRVAAYEMQGGLREHLTNRYLTFDATQVLSYGHDVMVIPDALALELTQ